MIYFKGSTAYELQIGPQWFRWCHLKGVYWRWKPWRRFSMGWDLNYWKDKRRDS